MLRYITIYGIQLPVYGLMVILGFIVANILLRIVCKQKSLKIKEAYILEIFGGIGATAGAKLLYQLENLIENGNLTELQTTSGYSFYGGMLLGIATLKICSYIFNIDIIAYTQNLCFIIPIMHSIWKFGCFFAGCCYGIKTETFIGVVFPEGAVAPSGIKLIPVQLIECVFLLLLSVILWHLNKKNKLQHPISTYILGYSLPRYFIEYYRWCYKYCGNTIAQWISLFCIFTILTRIIVNRIHNIRRFDYD